MPLMNKKTILAIIQQSEYDYKYVKQWFDRNKKSEEIKIEKHTLKLKLVSFLLSSLFFLPILIRIKISLKLIYPFDTIIKSIIIGLASIKLFILKLLGLKVVAIAGSYAKTSTKQIISQLLSSQITVVITPKSINTPIGIAGFILNELKFSDKLFIAELGEYYKGDIKKLTEFIHPDFGIVTPIGRQHLERMGDIKIIAETILELANYFNKTENVLISDQNSNYTNKDFNYYGSNDKSIFKVFNVKVSRRGTEFSIKNEKQNKVYSVYTPLYGEHQAANCLPSFWLATKLKIDNSKVANQCYSLSYIHRRHEPTFLRDNILLLDNSYNTNPDSFKASLKLIKELNHSRLIIVTFGFIELGVSSKEIHYKLGEELAKNNIFLGLIESPNSEFIKQGYFDYNGKKDHLVSGKNLDETIKLTEKFYVPNSIILIEGGFREIYT